MPAADRWRDFFAARGRCETKRGAGTFRIFVEVPSPSRQTPDPQKWITPSVTHPPPRSRTRSRTRRRVRRRARSTRLRPRPPRRTRRTRMATPAPRRKRRTRRTWSRKSSSTTRRLRPSKLRGTRSCYQRVTVVLTGMPRAPPPALAAAPATASAPAAAPQAPPPPPNVATGASGIQFVDGSVTPAKRKPGRPKGSKTKKPRLDSVAPAAAASSASVGPQYPGFKHAPPGPQPPPTSAYPEVNAHNKQYYDFQWRVLNLCSEFYLAAEQLLVSAFRSTEDILMLSVSSLPERGVSIGHRSIVQHGTRALGRPDPTHQQG
jgi:hypothetical protein